ncbi:hypothetical protein CspeluHIS016_0400940 [Cutaneotrichosporon spelunceum]|uniref:Uncharacterized protein n=1 Tax=Cutaneotrichosporon spelunceum TaxID=1672016 RepID=A0AAD3YBP6_9TREE|nr:hypothetical protein CspeluHIS016_0400940 [Cutaneotrichosporon spelunceum]
MAPEAVMSLPPGAAAPALGRVLDYDMNDAEFFSRSSVHMGTNDSGQPTIRCMSMSLDTFISGTHFSASKTNNHYRPSSTIMSHNMNGTPALPPRSYLRSASSPYTKTSSISSSFMTSGRTSPNRPYVLDVAPPPSADLPFSASPVEEIINFRPGPQRQVSYELPARATHHKYASYDDHRDPLKVRDHRPPRKSASGVYTPPTFPVTSSPPVSVPSTPSVVSNASYGSRSNFSPPSSAQSATSMSPPATPTTPMSMSVEHGIITIASESVDNIPLLDVDTTPKLPLRPVQITPAHSAERIVPLSPTAPKRARRKPVPRLDDDLVERLEAVQV